MAPRKTQVDLFILAGEMSGDAHGAEIIREWKHLRPISRVYGVGGPKMRKEGLKCLFPMEELQVMGFSDVLSSLPKLYTRFRKIKNAILELNPKQVLLIDYAEFNLLLAKALRKSGYSGKISQYVCPSVWAWRKGRIKTIEANFDEIFCFLPFEPKCFRKIKATYIGHPLLEMRYTTNPEKGHIGIFPGSRRKEIQANLPKQIEIAQKCAKKISISIAQPSLRPLIESLTPPNIELTEGIALMSRVEKAIATSGTVTLELYMHKVPTIVTYAISPIDQFLATKVFKINLDHYCLVNLIEGREIFPEFYGSNFNVQNAAQALDSIQSNSLSPDHCSSQFQSAFHIEK